MAPIARRLPLLAVLAAAGALAAADVAFDDGGLRVEVKGMGSFGFEYPKLEPGDVAPVERKPSGKTAELTYPNGVHASCAYADGKLELRFRDVPQAVHSFRIGTLIGPEYIDGGSWAFGKDEAKPFPKEKPEKPHLFQGNSGELTLRDASGHALTITTPDYVYHQLTDNREWGWKMFGWFMDEPYNRDWPVHAVGIVDSVAAGGTRKLIDPLGQPTQKSYPGKVTDEAELKADVAKEQAYYDSLKPMATDVYGGKPGTGAKLGLKKTGFFHVEEKGKRWLLVDPDGEACFHLGLCGVNWCDDYTYTAEREDIFAWLPPRDGEFAGAWHTDAWWHDKAFSFYIANTGRKYGTPIDRDAQIARLIDRVRKMGFNAAGAFSADFAPLRQKKFPIAQMVGMNPGLPGINGVPDPYDADTLARFERDCASWVKDDANDPLIVGYFFANEQAFEDIPRGVPQLPGKHAAKRKLIEQLKATYPSIAELNAAWGLELASFDAALDAGLPVTTEQAFADMRRYTDGFLEAYYAALETTFRTYDKNHLMLGNRWQPGTANNESLCRAAGRHLDAISVNYYTLGVDRAFMQRIHQWTGDKPQLWSEFYYTSGDESACAGGGADMKTQKARGEAYRTYVEDGASLGFVVGIEWFTLIDQAVTGRFFSKLNGERANTGLFDVTDRPYRDCIAEMAAANREVYDVWLDGKAPYRIDDPRFGDGSAKARKTIQAGHATGAIAIDGSVTGWPGRPPERIGSDRLVNGKDGKGLEASFKVCWDETNLYLLAQITDPTPLINGGSGDGLWNGDGVELFVGSEALDDGGPLRFSDHQLLLGAKRDHPAFHLVNAAKQPDVKLTAIPAVDGSGYTLEAAVPWSSLGVKPSDKTTLLFDLGIDDAATADGGRARQLMWNGGARNSGDRSHWGRLQLVP